MFTAIVALITGVVAFGVGFVAGRGSAVVGPAAMGLPGGSAPKGLPMRSEDVLRANPRDLRQGGLVTVKNFGDDFEDVDLELEGYTKFTRDQDEWHEVESDYRGRKVGLGWAKGGDVYALKQLGTKRLEDVGLAADKLQALTKGAEVEAEGFTYLVKDLGKTLSHANGTGFGKELQSWDLFTADGKQLIRVERRGDDTPQVTQGERVDASDVEIFRVKG